MAHAILMGDAPGKSNISAGCAFVCRLTECSIANTTHTETERQRQSIIIIIVIVADYYCYYYSPNGCCYLSPKGINTRLNVSNYKTIALEITKHRNELMHTSEMERESGMRRGRSLVKKYFHQICVQWLFFPLIFDMLHTCSVNFIQPIRTRHFPKCS